MVDRLKVAEYKLIPLTIHEDRKIRNTAAKPKSTAVIILIISVSLVTAAAKNATV
jgi:hypothetical protein